MSEDHRGHTPRVLEAYKMAFLISTVVYIGMAVAFVAAVVLAGDDVYQLARPKLLFAYIMSFMLFSIILRIAFRGE